MSYNDGKRAKELPSNWSSIRARILRRDGFTCRWLEDDNRCLNRANEVDHIIRGDDHSPENLQSLCKIHHAMKTSKEALAAKREKRANLFAAYGRPKESRFD